VHERAPELNEIGAGLGLWPAALAVFDRLGLGDAVRDLSGPWEVAGLRRADGSFLVRYTVEQMTERLGGPTIGVHRGELQALLLAALPSEVVHTGAACTDVVLRPHDVVLRFDDGSEHAAAAVIAADGRRSIVRNHVFGTSPLHDCRAVGWRGTAPPRAGDAWSCPAGETWGGDIVFGVLPLSNGRMSWYAAARSVLDDGGRDELRRRLAHLHDPVPQLLDATPDDQIWRDAIDDLWPVRRWVRGRVALLGDAAHPMAPDLGQGACQAILDAWSISTELVADLDDPGRAFARYQRTRRPRAAGVALAARALTYGGGFRGGPLAPLREATLGHLPPTLMLRGLQAMAAGGRGAPRAGTRAGSAGRC
jgi:2-polyprenyl-6-methoxyphenol hydroxylase-like FAD-dependent oxidoreductase